MQGRQWNKKSYQSKFSDTLPIQSINGLIDYFIEDFFCAAFQNHWLTFLNWKIGNFSITERHTGSCGRSNH